MNLAELSAKNMLVQGPQGDTGIQGPVGQSFDKTQYDFIVQKLAEIEDRLKALEV